MYIVKGIWRHDDSIYISTKNPKTLEGHGFVGLCQGGDWIEETVEIGLVAWGYDNIETSVWGD